VWALVVLNGLLLTCWSILTPIYHAPDEPTHADAVMRLVEGYGWGHVGHTEITRHGDAATVASPYGTPQHPRLLSTAPIPAADSVPRYERADWGDLVDPTRPYKRATVQQMTQHPPGYYYVEAAVIRAFGGDHQRWDRAVGLMRLVSVLMIAPLPLLAWATTFRLVGDRRAGIAAAAVPLAIPELTHIGGVINNDNALTLTGGLVLVGIACVLRGDRRRRTAVFLGVTLGLALFSKGIALVLPPLVVAAYVTAWAYDRRRAPEAQPPLPLFRTLVPPVAIVALLSFACGGWWYLTNLIHYGAVQPPVPGFPPGEFLGNNVGRLASLGTSSMLQRYWGSIGWYEVQLPFNYVYAAGAVSFALLVVAIVRSRRPEGTRPALLLMLWPTLASYGLVVAQAINWYRETHYYRGLSGRYLFVGAVGVAVVLGIGATRIPALRRWAPLAILAGGAAMQAKAVWLAVIVWWRPHGGSLRQAWDALLSWAPWSPTIVKGVLVLTAVAALLVVAELIRVAWRPDVQQAGSAV
jgi:small subunit ribosomal protein S36